MDFEAQQRLVTSVRFDVVTWDHHSSWLGPNVAKLFTEIVVIVGLVGVAGIFISVIAIELHMAWHKPCVAEARQRRGERVLHQIHFNCSMTVPSEIVGRATPVLLAFLAIHSRAARVLSSAPALSW